MIDNKFIKDLFELLNVINSKVNLKLLPISLVIAITTFTEMLSLFLLGNFLSSFMMESKDKSSLFFLNYDFSLQVKGFLSGLALLLSVVFRLISQSYLAHVSQMVRHQISVLLIQNYLSDRCFGQFDYSQGLKSILSACDQLREFFIYPSYMLLSGILVSLGITGVLVSIVGAPAILALTLLLLTYVCIYLVVRRKLDYIGVQIEQSDKRRYQTSSESLSLRQENLLSSEAVSFLQTRYSDASNTFAVQNSLANILGESPRYIIEGLLYVSGIWLLLFAERQTAALSFDKTASLTLIVTSLFALYRLMPMAQAVYHSLSKLQIGVGIAEPIILRLTTNILPGQSLCESKPESNYDNWNPDKYSKRKLEIRRVKHSNRLMEKSYSFEFGQCYLLTGPSGSGKTTLLKILSGAIRDYDGKVIYPFQVDPSLIDKHIAYLAQTPKGFEASVGENIYFNEYETHADQVRGLLSVLKVFPNEPHEKLLDVGLTEHAKNLSGGQLQRVAFVREIIKNCPIILLDEPFSALDKKSITAVEQILQQQVNQGKLVIIVSHIIPQHGLDYKVVDLT